MRASESPGQVGDQVTVKYCEALALRVLAPGERRQPGATGATATAPARSRLALVHGR
jgi:hypothetical protein